MFCDWDDLCSVLLFRSSVLKVFHKVLETPSVLKVLGFYSISKVLGSFSVIDVLRSYSVLKVLWNPFLFLNFCDPLFFFFGNFCS